MQLPGAICAEGLGCGWTLPYGGSGTNLVIFWAAHKCQYFYDVSFGLANFPKEESYSLLLAMPKSGCQLSQSQVGQAAGSLPF